jgi:hypothetical protein
MALGLEPLDWQEGLGEVIKFLSKSLATDNR